MEVEFTNNFHAEKMNFDALSYVYPSKRSVIYGRKGMVCTTQPLGAQAGLDILKKGGNAVDAAIATAICMTVLEPTGNGIGSDAFALVWMKNQLYGLNGSGSAPRSLSLAQLKADGYKTMPMRGLPAIMVPGAPATWAKLHQRFGRLPFAELFKPAISYATEGFPVQTITHHLWGAAAEVFAPYRRVPAFQAFFETFFPNGVPRPGDVVRLPDHARTLQELAATGCESFYHGRLARAMGRFLAEVGGYLTEADLAAYEPEWVAPLQATYRGYQVCELPPNGQGIVTLMALNILERFAVKGHDDPETVHKQLEAMKLAFTDGKLRIADSHTMQTRVEYLLSAEYADRRSREIGREALLPTPVDTNCGGTVYLCTADAEGNMVSYIQSNYKGFGSGIVVPGTGISLNNRGYSFSLDPQSDNCLAPGKRPYNTIIPGFLLKEGRAIGPFGLMGAFMQPQGHVQMLMNMLDFGMNPQAALDAPRWQWVGGKNIEVEPGFSKEVIAKLRQRGHNVHVSRDFISFGKGQSIYRDDQGVLIGATEGRADGQVASW